MSPRGDIRRASPRGDCSAAPSLLCTCFGPSPGNANGLRSVADEGLRGSLTGFWVGFAVYLDGQATINGRICAVGNEAEGRGFTLLYGTGGIQLSWRGVTGPHVATVPVSPAAPRMVVGLAWYDGTSINLQLDNGTPATTAPGEAYSPPDAADTFDIGERSDANGATFVDGTIFGVMGSDAQTPDELARASFWASSRLGCAGFKGIAPPGGEVIGTPLAPTHKWVAPSADEAIGTGHDLTVRGAFPLDSTRPYRATW